ncbi:hypothetical protein P153DRAFT_361763 [Dothidotthia symphoricarpi CBS 119687]|uniref:Uncharacterized protein n=1 Tax=Dothidotthia symphoricarpi CBS 119687 TaxID=1392245 RepID=A0A6A5ZW79_9PLEO|nr:uncharacterized protein P153DRAFT_361763 [Dothidotthia symphoricarpi CBS 119687]KAF2123789.1 hypothetical protein P153DRAFT_361763 [Dothidotthia symphoricarpi CBS 119687]
MEHCPSALTRLPRCDSECSRGNKRRIPGLWNFGHSTCTDPREEITFNHSLYALTCKHTKFRTQSVGRPTTTENGEYYMQTPLDEGWSMARLTGFNKRPRERYRHLKRLHLVLFHKRNVLECQVLGQGVALRGVAGTELLDITGINAPDNFLAVLGWTSFFMPNMPRLMLGVNKYVCFSTFRFVLGNKDTENDPNLHHRPPVWVITCPNPNDMMIRRPGLLWTPARCLWKGPICKDDKTITGVRLLLCDDQKAHPLLPEEDPDLQRVRDRDLELFNYNDIER